jgi:hypothetical protein
MVARLKVPPLLAPVALSVVMPSYTRTASMSTLPAPRMVLSSAVTATSLPLRCARRFTRPASPAALARTSMVEPAARSMDPLPVPSSTRPPSPPAFVAEASSRAPLCSVSESPA